MNNGDNVKKSIEFLNKQLRFIINKFNDENINYYIVGAIGAYIDAKIPFKREHDDLDIMIEEKDIEKVRDIFKDSYYTFFDNRVNSGKYLNEYGYPQGEHEVYALYKENDFHIGFFLFNKEDTKYTIIEYFKDGEKCKKLERSLPIEIFKYQYNDNCIYDNERVKVARKELIYKNKIVMNREKDVFDINNLKDSIDDSILSKLKGLSKVRITQIVDVDND